MTFTKPVVIAAAVVLAGVLAFAVARARGWRMRFDLLFMLVPTAVLFVAVAIRAFAVGGDIHAPGGPSGRLLFVGVAGLAAVAGAAALGLPRRIRGWAPLTVLALAGGLQAEAVRLTLNHFWGFADDPTAALRAAAGWSAWPGSVLAALGLITGLVALIAVVALVRVEEQEDALPARATRSAGPRTTRSAGPRATRSASPRGRGRCGHRHDDNSGACRATAGRRGRADGRRCQRLRVSRRGHPNRRLSRLLGEWEPYPRHRVTLPQEPTGVQGPQETQRFCPRPRRRTSGRHRRPRTPRTWEPPPSGHDVVLACVRARPREGCARQLNRVRRAGRPRCDRKLRCDTPATPLTDAPANALSPTRCPRRFCH